MFSLSANNLILLILRSLYKAVIWVNPLAAKPYIQNTAPVPIQKCLQVSIMCIFLGMWTSITGLILVSFKSLKRYLGYEPGIYFVKSKERRHWKKF